MTVSSLQRKVTHVRPKEHVLALNGTHGSLLRSDQIGDTYRALDTERSLPMVTHELLRLQILFKFALDEQFVPESCNVRSSSSRGSF